MINYNGYTISKLARRGVYEVTDNSGNLVIVLPLLAQAKKFIDKKVA
jgi:hypothetical protein